ncbi:MAG: SURF1 family protein [Chloroflexota bacterium]
MNRISEIARALVSRRWWWVTLIVIGLMIVLARLGIWQLHRLEERRAANAALIAALDSPPIDLNIEGEELVDHQGDLTDLENRDVVAHGEYDFDNQLVLKLQNYDNLSGVNLVTPLLLEGTDLAVLIDRGWIPDADVAAENWAAYETNGPVEVEGYVALSEKLRRQPSAVSAPTGALHEIYRVDIAAIQPDLSYTLLPFYVKESPPPGEQTTPPLLTEREVDLSEGPHQGYALQWFTFSIGLGVAYVIFVNRQMTIDREAETGKKAD